MKRPAVLWLGVLAVVALGGAAGAIMLAGQGAREAARKVPLVVPPPPQWLAEAPLAAGAELPPPSAVEAALRNAVAAAGGVAALDPVALSTFAGERARAEAADALLLGLSCFPVRAPGRADLTLARGSCRYEWRSPVGARRPADVPTGLPADVPCLLSWSVDASVRGPDVQVTRGDQRRCHMHQAVRPPRCTADEVWTRAVAAGVPADAVARVAYGGRYRSGYDPVDPAEVLDRPARGRWTVTVDRDGASDLRVELADDCGQGPPTADEQAVISALRKATPALQRCFRQATAGNPTEASIEAVELIWRLAIDGRGAVTVAFADPGVDIEGLFRGDLDGIRSRWDSCAGRVARGLRLPAALREVRVELRLERGGALEVQPPPFE